MKTLVFVAVLALTSCASQTSSVPSPMDLVIVQLLEKELSSMGDGK